CRWNAVPFRDTITNLADEHAISLDDLGASLAGRDHRVDDQIGRQSHEVDILLVLRAPVDDERVALVRIGNLRDLPGVHGVYRGLRSHDGDLGGRQRNTYVRHEARAGYRIEPGAVGFEEDDRELRNGRLGHGGDHLGAVADD